jgi:hypothetical protein
MFGHYMLVLMVQLVLLVLLVPGSNGIDAQYVIVTGEQAFKFLSGSTQSTSLNFNSSIIRWFNYL